MQACVSTWNRFHFFDLAEQLHNQGMLHSLFTTLPSYKAKKDIVFSHVPESKLYTYPPFFMLQTALNRILSDTKLNEKGAVLTTKTYQSFIKKYLMSHMDDIDAYIAISGSGFEGGQHMVEHGKIYCFDRGSTEITYQLAVVKHLHQSLSLPCRDVDRWLIDNETNEAQIATAITVPSNFCRQTYINKGFDAKKIHVIPYGVNLNEFYRETNLRPSSRNQLIFCGQFCIRKGAHLLVDYFKRNPYLDCTLSVVGSVNPNLSKHYESSSISNIEFHGVVPRAEVRRYMQDAKALILPSYEEGLALVMPQALACGIPVIASEQSGATEFIRDGFNGFILENISTKAIHNAIVRLFSLTGDEYDQMSLNCVASVKDLGGWKHYGNKWADLLNRIVNLTTP
jgi:glycosyltransferase involved in cell wall biosynthesis